MEGSCGEIGGSFSHEYHYECSDGEDSLLVCGECGESVSEELLIETSVSTRGDEVQCTKCRGAVMRRTTGIEVRLLGPDSLTFVRYIEYLEIHRVSYAMFT